MEDAYGAEISMRTGVTRPMRTDREQISVGNGYLRGHVTVVHPVRRGCQCNSACSRRHWEYFSGKHPTNGSKTGPIRGGEDIHKPVNFWVSSSLCDYASTLHDAYPSCCGIFVERVLKLKDKKGDDDMGDCHQRTADAEERLATWLAIRMTTEVG